LSGNLMDVCPVGAITTRDYRFKSRPWDNPHAVDTICTMCEKGCNTTGWIKAKPEWAKGARLIRMTPRFNEQVNQYWMCDIGRFDYHWVESDRRLLQPHVRAGVPWEAVAWDAAFVAVQDAVKAAGGPAAVQFLVSAHASLEELFVIKNIAANTGGVTLSWRHREKPQPANSKFKIPTVDAPNVHGAKDLGFAVGNPSGAADISAIKTAVESGRVKVLYVIDNGPDGSIGDTAWILAARKAGKISTLIVQAVLHTELADAADILLPGSAFVEKDSTYTNMTGHVQATSKVIPRPGDSGDDWEILTHLAPAFGSSTTFASADAVRQAIAQDPQRQARVRVARIGLVLPPRLGPPLAGILEPVGTLEVGLHVPGPAPGQIRRGFWRNATSRRYSLTGSEITEVAEEEPDAPSLRPSLRYLRL
jgi:NADH-quinone oxidoreductase subunit G